MAGETTTITTLTILMRFDLQDRQTFLDALRVINKITRKLPELLFFDISESQEHPGTFHLVEIWSKSMEHLLNVKPCPCLSYHG